MTQSGIEPYSSVESNNPKPEPKPRRRRRWPWILLGLFVLFIALLGGGLLYLQTQHAFRHVLLPLIASRIENKIEVAEGTVTLPLKVHLKGVRVSNKVQGDIVRAKLIRADLDPFSLFGASVPLLRTLEIDTAEIFNYSEDEEVTQVGDNIKLTADKKAVRKATSKEDLINDRSPIVPASLEEIRLKNCTITMLNNEERLAVFSSIDLEVDDLVADKKGHAKFDAEFTVAPDDADRKRTGFVSMEGAVNQTRGGQDIDWNGTAGASAAEGPAVRGSAPIPPMSIDIKTSGSMQGHRSIKSNIIAAGEVDSRPSGRLTGQIDWDRVAEKMHSDLTLNEIGHNLANLILPMFGPAQFESGMVDGFIKVESVTDGYRFDSSLNAFDLSVKAAADQDATPPMAITSTQSGSWNTAKEETTLEKVQVILQKEKRVLGTIQLDKSITLRMNSAAAGTAAQTDSSIPEEAHLNLEISKLAVDDVRPWLAIVDNHSLDDVQKGNLDGKLTLDILASGTRLGLKGDVDIAGVMLKSEEEDSARGPFRFVNKINGTAQDLDHFTFEKSTLKISEEKQQLVDAEISGYYKVKLGESRIDAGLVMNDFGATMTRLGVFKPDQTVKFREGKLNANVAMQRAQKGKEMILSGDGNLKNLTMISEGDKSIQRSVATKYSVTLNAANTGATIKDLSLILSKADGKSAGSATATGFWPLKYFSPKDKEAAKAPHGKVVLQVRGLDSQPWIEFLDLLPENEIDSAPLETDLTIGIDPTGEQMTFEGEERFGPLRTKARESAGTPPSVSVKNNGLVMTKLGESRVDLVLAANDIGGTLKGLGLIKADQSIQFREGKLDAALNLQRKNEGKEMLAKGKSSISNVTLVSNGEKQLKRSINTQYSVAMDSATNTSTIQELVLNLVGADGKPAGNLAINGYWPLKKAAEGEKDPPAPRDGKLQVKSQGMDARPWLEFFGIGDVARFDTVPIDGTMNIAMDKSGERYLIDGDQKIGPIRMTAANGPGETVMMNVRSKIDKQGENLRSFVIDMTSDRQGGKQGVKDSLRAEGSGTLGERPNIKTNVQITSLDANLYAEAFGGQKPADPKAQPGKPASKQTPAPPAKPEKQTDAEAPPAKPSTEWPFDLDASLQIGHLAWRDLILDEGKAAITADRRDLAINIDAVKINGGTLAGQVGVRAQEGEAPYTWKIQAENFDVNAVLGSINTDMKGKVTGIGTLASQGTGYRGSEESSRKTTGAIVFDLKDGQMSHSRLLDYIAEVTHVDAFRQVLFHTFHGDISLDQGSANLNDVWVRGLVTQLIARGKIGLDGAMEVAVQPGVGSTLTTKLIDNPLTRHLQGFANLDKGYFQLPLSVTVTGTTSEMRYGVRPETPGTVGAVEGLVKGGVGGTVGAIQGVAKGDVSGTVNAVGGAANAVGGAAKEGVGGTVNAVGETIDKIGSIGGKLLKKKKKDKK